MINQWWETWLWQTFLETLIGFSTGTKSQISTGYLLQSSSGTFSHFSTGCCTGTWNTQWRERQKCCPPHLVTVLLGHLVAMGDRLLDWNLGAASLRDLLTLPLVAVPKAKLLVTCLTLLLVRRLVFSLTFLLVDSLTLEWRVSIYNSVIKLYVEQIDYLFFISSLIGSRALFLIRSLALGLVRRGTFLLGDSCVGSLVDCLALGLVAVLVVAVMVGALLVEPHVMIAAGAVMAVSVSKLALLLDERVIIDFLRCDFVSRKGCCESNRETNWEDYLHCYESKLGLRAWYCHILPFWWVFIAKWNPLDSEILL